MGTANLGLQSIQAPRIPNTTSVKTASGLVGPDRPQLWRKVSALPDLEGVEGWAQGEESEDEKMAVEAERLREVNK